MGSEKLPDPILIKHPAELADLADKLRREAVIAVDTESNSLYAYQEQVCLIQFSTREQDYLVDPLAVEDLSPLAPIFRDPDIEKVFHAAEYDLLCLKRDYGFQFNNLFDTMHAARILGREAFGLGAILEEEFGVKLDKRFQRANWGQRPLPPDLLAYARLDTHFLISLRERLRKELRESGRWELAQEDFQRMRNVPEMNGRAHDDTQIGCWRVSGATDLTPQQAAVLFQLCKYRDRVARASNRPLFKVINDRTLLEIAINTPANMRELGRIPGMTYGQVQRHGNALLSAIQRGLDADPLYPPRQTRPSDDFLERVDRLKRWRKNTAQTMDVKSDVVLPRDLLYELAEKAPKDMEALAEVMAETRWRLERFGEEILDQMLRVEEH
jgi:ribonuclease D